MAQKLLDRPEIASALEEVGGEGVAERVSAGLRADRRSHQAASDDTPDGAVRKGLSKDPDEQGISA